MKVKGSKGRISIERELCKGCTYCILSCPKGVIGIDGEFNKNGYFPARVCEPDACTGCTLCAQMCPEIAIMVWREEEGEEDLPDVSS